MIALMMILCLTLFLPGSVYADDIGVSVKCPSDIKSGEEFTCDLIGYSRYKVLSYSPSPCLPALALLPLLQPALEIGWPQYRPWFSLRYSFLES